jgi:hypothetical protein
MLLHLQNREYVTASFLINCLVLFIRLWEFLTVVNIKSRDPLGYNIVLRLHVPPKRQPPTRLQGQSLDHSCYWLNSMTWGCNSRVKLHVFLNSALHIGEWRALPSGRFYPSSVNISIDLETVCGPQSVWAILCEGDILSLHDNRTNVLQSSSLEPCICDWIKPATGVVNQEVTAWI